MSKPVKPWFRFQKGARKPKDSSSSSSSSSKDASPFSGDKAGRRASDNADSDDKDAKNGAGGQNNNNNNNSKSGNNNANGKLKQSSLSRFFATPTPKSNKRPHDDDDDDDDDDDAGDGDSGQRRPSKRRNGADDDEGERRRKSKTQLAKFQFGCEEEEEEEKESKEKENGGGEGGGGGSSGAAKTAAKGNDRNGAAGNWLAPPAPPDEKKTGVKNEPISGGGAKTKLTPLEQQFVDLKKRYPDAILLIECGYKFRFFGDDADVAGRVLNIVSHLDHNFNTASIPAHRLFVHVRRLVAKGYKVGVVKQTETAALKASSDSKSGLFQRSLSALYTKSTLVGRDVEAFKTKHCTKVDEEEDGDEVGFKMEENINDDNSGILICVTERPVDPKARGQSQPSSGWRFCDVRISFVAVSPSTGKITVGAFDDAPSRSQLETQLALIAPCEVLLPPGLSRGTEKVFERLCRNPEDVRMEKMAKPMVDPKTAAQRLSLFCKESSSHSFLLDLDSDKQKCVVALIDYLKDFRLDSVFNSSSSSSSSSSPFRMSASVVRNLELFVNLSDGKESGTLFKVLNQTQTRFGDRLLRKWMSQPLVDAAAIEARLDAVEEALADEAQFYASVKSALKGLMDLERGLATIFYKKCSILDFISIVSSLSRLRVGLSSAKSVVDSISSPLVRDAFRVVDESLEDVDDFLSALDEDAVKRNDKRRTFRRYDEYPRVGATLAKIAGVEEELENHLPEIRRILSAPSSMRYVSVSGKEYLVEIKCIKANEALRGRVPEDWISVQSTKACSRYHTPFVNDKYKRLLALREQLDLDVDDAWMTFLDEFNVRQYHYQRAVQSLATIDAILSLAQVAKNRNYRRPRFSTDGRSLVIFDGRHPIIETLVETQSDGAQFVPNHTNLTKNGQRCMIVTGPNMGGKSSYIRQVALSVIMAQMGSFVAASSATLSLFDGVFVRMGASDQILRGASTFMVEMTEASEMMRDATADSLVILDELGRGTSTHDGTAIATATLEHFVRDVGCFTLFVTHYPLITKLAEKYRGIVENYHMSFMLDDDEEGGGQEKRMEDKGEEETTKRWEEREEETKEEGGGGGGEEKGAKMESILDKGKNWSCVQMLYSLSVGKADRSFGLNVGRMAGIEPDVIRKAAQKSKQLEECNKVAANRKSFRRLIETGDVELDSL